ncbi:MAG: hypothetical protein GXP19_05145 [Gammaproteobacteria bacterium]|nr:hypothetical protein [Gammaproteobacteria bacterium]
MKKLSIGVILLASSIGFISQATAANFDQYRKLAKGTISEAASGKISNASIDKLIANQETLIKIGMSAMSEYASSHPDVAEVLNMVKDKATSMQKLSLSEIEAQWHEGGYLKSKGVDVDKVLGQKSAAGSLMDTVVHPATVIIVLNEYKKKADKKHLDQIKDELDEVLNHLEMIK